MSRAELNESATIMADEFGSVGTYTPVVGTPVTVAPVMTYGFQLIDDFGAYELRDRANIDMAEYPGEPEQGDSLVVGDDSYTVDTWEQVGSMWHITLRIGVAPAPPVDTTPPYITTIQVNGGLGIATSRTVSVDVLIAADDMSSVLDMTYLVNTVPGTPPSTMDPGWLSYANRLTAVTVPADGNYTFTGYAKDEAGNVSIGQEFAQQAVFIDSIAPEVVSGQVDVTGLVLTLGMSEPVTGNLGFSMTADGLDVAISNPTAPDASTIQFDVEQVYQGKVLLLSYTAGDVVDQVGNPLADFADQSVTNSSDVIEVVIPVLSAFTYDPDTFEVLDKEVGVGAVATSRVAVINVPDDQGVYRQMPTETIAYDGARVVNNYISGSNGFTAGPGDIAWAENNIVRTDGIADPYGGTSAITIESLVSNATAYISQTPPVKPQGDLSSLWIRRRTGAGDVLLYSGGSILNLRDLIDSTWRRVYRWREGSSDYMRLAVLAAGDEVDIAFFQLEDSYLATIPGEVFPTEPRTAADHLPLVQYANSNGNTVDGDYVTEAVGGLLAQSPYAAVAPEATNYFLNSQAPVTQDVAGRTGDHTVSVIGAGTVTLSGGMAGVASEGSPVAGDPGGVTVTCTVAGGPPANVQFEDNATATYPIYTTTVPVTRDKDAITLDSANLSDTAGTIVFDTVQPADGDNGVISNFLDRISGVYRMTDGTTNIDSAVVNGSLQVGMVWGNGVMDLAIDGVWVGEQAYDGTLPGGVLDLFRDSAYAQRIMNLKIYDRADKGLVA